MIRAVVNSADAIAKMAALAKTIDAQAKGGLLTVGQWAEGEIKRLAPKDTGAYAASITTYYQDTVHGAEVVIGTSMPYGARLELGYTGPDRLGRRFSQAPQPHFGPVADAIPARMVTHMSQVFS